MADEVVMLGLGLVDFVEAVFHSDVEFGFVIEPIGIWICHLDLELRFRVVFGFVVLVWMWIGCLCLCLCFGLSEGIILKLFLSSFFFDRFFY